MKILVAICIVTLPFAGLCKSSQDSSSVQRTGTPTNGSVLNDAIKTLTISLNGTAMSYPVVYLHGSQNLQVSFDELSTETKTYYYTAIHCNANWQPSSLIKIDYLRGIEDAQITDASQSHNTMVDYMHYSFNIPSEDFTILKSGNYIVKIFEEKNKDKPVAQFRMMVVDNVVGLTASAKQAGIVDKMDQYQEVNFTVNLNKYSIRDPFSDIKVAVLQNGRWDNAITDIKPLFVNNDEVVYNLEGNNLFAGGNEFRRFNFKTFKYITEHVKSFTVENMTQHVNLLDDEPRRYMMYYENTDLDGNCYIANEMGDEKDIDAEYAWVNFTLKCDMPEVAGNVYVLGELTNWEVSPLSEMRYDLESMSYKASIFLKQGFYDYQYAVYDTLNNIVDCSSLENSHWETENDYQVIVYHSDPLAGYDKIIGYTLINNKKKK